eukprot:TRINITY_DN7178_c0_g1_i1.p1 TRINITY_DN7178_c0_g1~~TRINITY_DN7178_c0_g1_i1.p1  ORF type:complete len:681 (+),score=128.81 TRINITY_DN7178_c0_g1_i1:193-2235(+)
MKPMLALLLAAAVSSADIVPTYFHRQYTNGSLVDGLELLNDKALTPSGRRVIEPSTAVLGVSQTSLYDGEVVTVTWNNVESPTSKDWIGFYCPSDAPNTEYVDYFWVTAAATYEKGYGQVNQTMSVLRGTCEFRYLRNDSYTAIATSPTVSFSQATPYHVHISLTGNQDEMRIMWVSNSNTTSVVYWGEGTDITTATLGDTWTYAAADMCGPPANTTGFVDPGYMHSVILTGLKPKTKYSYKVGQPTLSNTSTFSFTSSPETRGDYEFQFVAYADMGLSAGARATARGSLYEILDREAELIVHPGDISYARGTAYVWDKWMALIEPYASLVPYMVGIGNHEYDHTTGGDKDPSKAPGTGFHPSWGNFGDDSSGECGVPMYQRFKMPANGNSLFWYSFNYGSVHFIMMSSEHDCSKGSPQYGWLEADLAAVDRSNTPWVVLMAHRPMYDSEQYPADYDVAVGMQHEFEDLIYKKVDLALYGHYHSHERTCPVYRNKCQPPGEAPIHIVIGSAGATLDVDKLYGKNWSMFFDNDYGYGRVTVANETAMHWEYVRTKDNMTINDAWVYKAGVPESWVRTEQGCECQQPWVYKNHSYYNCWNPDASDKNWCYVKGSDCGTVGPDGLRRDSCSKPVITTKTGCTCITPFEYGGLRYYNCTDADVQPGQSWCYVSGECGGKDWDFC